MSLSLLRWRSRHLITPLLTLAVGTLLLAQKPPPPSADEKLPQAPPEQPIPFNHAIHIAASIKCMDCHVIPEPGFEAGIPKESVCMGCHVTIKKDSPYIRKLAESAKSKMPLPWVRIYSVPDYVWFSHDLHVRETKFECETCHGPVATREAVFKEKSTAMASCIECHAKHDASKGCDICHSSR